MLINKIIKSTIGIEDYRVKQVLFDGRQIIIDLDSMRHRFSLWEKVQSPRSSSKTEMEGNTFLCGTYR